MIKLPIVTLKKNVEIKSINGQLVFDLHEQILTILSRDVDPILLRLFFAEPVLNEVKGEVSWYTHATGSVRRFGDLAADEQEKISNTLREFDAQLKASADNVAKAGNQHGWFSDATRAMLSTPDLYGSLFVVGDTPVLSQWGCTPFGADPSRHQIIVSDTSSIKQVAENQQISEPPSSQPPPLDELLTASTASSPDMSPVIGENDEDTPLAEPSERNIFNWRDHVPMLISLFLLLLLIIGLILNYRYSDTSRAIAIEVADAKINQIWGTIAQRAQQCEPQAAILGLEQITPEVVQRDLQQEGVNIGESLNISLAWGRPVDLDLAVFEPSGSRINFENTVSDSSGRLDIDANRKVGAVCDIVQGRNPVENISWDRTVVPGIYRVVVNLYSMCDVTSGDEVIPFKLLVTRAGMSPEAINGQLSNSARNFTYDLELP